MPEFPKLLFDLTFGVWLFKYQGACWDIKNISIALTLSEYMDVNFVEVANRSDDETKGTLLSVNFTDEGAEFLVRSVAEPEADEKTGVISDDIVLIPLNIINLGWVRKSSGIHGDYWAETRASLELVDIQKLGFKFYLPEVEDQDGKTIIFKSDDHSELMQQFIRRGKMTEVWVEPNQIQGTVFIETSDSESGNGDARQLGVLLTEININAAGWKSVLEIL